MENDETQFMSLFKQIAPQYRRAEVFDDFIALSALEMYQITYGTEADKSLRERFQQVKARYRDEEFTQLAQLFAIVIRALTKKRYDFLGSVFMKLELGNGYKGQYFTPSHIADLMAKVTLEGCQEKIKRQGFITLSEPTCGSGVMVIGCVNAMFELGLNPQQQLWACCQDIDFTAAMMCYIQLSLLHIPACIVVGDSLKGETKVQMYTLAHLMGNWSYKLEQKENIPTASEPITEAVIKSEQVKSSNLPVIGQLPLLEGEQDGIPEDEVIFY
ncbi:N-6 DNA methylase [Pasteurella multocida]